LGKGRGEEREAEWRGEESGTKKGRERYAKKAKVETNKS